MGVCGWVDSRFLVDMWQNCFSGRFLSTLWVVYLGFLPVEFLFSRTLTKIMTNFSQSSSHRVFLLFLWVPWLGLRSPWPSAEGWDPFRGTSPTFGLIIGCDMFLVPCHVFVGGLVGILSNSDFLLTGSLLSVTPETMCFFLSLSVEWHFGFWCSFCGLLAIGKNELACWLAGRVPSPYFFSPICVENGST